MWSIAEINLLSARIEHMTEYVGIQSRLKGTDILL
jgi:hypothetical protein